MGSIRVLNKNLISRIAAGEVVERPASVVKELIENSIDSGARKILIEVTNGGKSQIKVSDDGTGMESIDALLAVEQHATSKIKNAKDLFNIHTFGFRGEALSSISSISRLELRTNTDNEGIKLELEGGKIIKNSSHVMPTGTTIIVSDIFFNTPARLKHMKTSQTELRHIVDVVTKYAIVYPGIYFELVEDNKPLIDVPGEDWRSRISSIFGNMSKKLLEVVYDEDIKVTGFVSGRGLQFPSRKYQELFVNSRPVRSKTIRDAVYESYHTLLNVGKHPVFFMNLQIDPRKVDVNVHPQKLTVRFDKETEIANAVRVAIKKTLAGQEEPETTVEVSKEKPLTLEKYSFVKETQDNFIQKSSLDYRILGQILHTYVIVATRDGMMVIDQHAAQERVKYERFMREFLDNEVVTQRLLEPLVIETSPAESVLIMQFKDLLQKLGFEVTEFGKNSFMLRTVPIIFKKLQGRDAFLTIVDELKIGKTTKLDEVKEERIIKKACRTSIKANEKLEHNEIVEVINELFQAENPHTCPHGRPTMIKFTSQEFEKMFRRRL